MSATATIVLIVVVLLVLAAIVLGVRAMRRRKLQQTFGPEYDRVVADTGNRTEAERELHERTKRHAQLELRPLSGESRAKYATAWEEVQIRFVDNPKEAVSTADELVTALIAERGYPTGDYDERLANLSVEHAATLEHYRAAHEISRRSRNGETETEDLRQALVHYRALFADLLGEDPVGHASTPAPRPAADDHTAISGDAPARTVNDTEDTATEPGVARSRPDATSR
ncbi:hypothetical protein AMIS_10250 [Actinoplanes missouriensis 431]|uniref:Secreted protein n=1 Tax=Actinoplanes missouriensis (strain ATCC 14538 / DSM 43046 / CBS 188.64 / JCM 3121 / NBRC 102363 / NCIMB 12654 / NRRL B-3342 / UNCC 431) TaxID=512565 RepID=I0GZQ8_ACTM4|nr:hypothetical protein [Actinoplanes missouriensis]BAL86245.1 hypothetical protein AMIS_10250 [Actinoplanes missouriensis 431]